MTLNLTHNTFKAIKNPSDNSVVIYHALAHGEEFEISARRYIEKLPCECVSFMGVSADVESIERFLLEICHECLEPCHLKDVVEDHFGLC